MNAVKQFSAEELGDMDKNAMLNLIGDKEGKKLFTQLTIEKSGECWHVSDVYFYFTRGFSCSSRFTMHTGANQNAPFCMISHLERFSCSKSLHGGSLKTD